MRQLSASPALMASSTARRLSTGSAPGSPRQTGQTFVFGDAPKLVGQPQKIFVAVASWTWTSSPITGSYFAIASGVARSMKLVDIVFIIVGRTPSSARDPLVAPPAKMKFVHHLRRYRRQRQEHADALARRTPPRGRAGSSRERRARRHA